MSAPKFFDVVTYTGRVCAGVPEWGGEAMSETMTEKLVRLRRECEELRYVPVDGWTLAALLDVAEAAAEAVPPNRRFASMLPTSAHVKLAGALNKLDGQQPQPVAAATAEPPCAPWRSDYDPAAVKRGPVILDDDGEV